jgi:hypothetical protein
VWELQQLELILGMINTIEAECDASASAKAKVEHSNAKKIQDQSIEPELLPHSSAKRSTESFDNRKHLAGYVGLTPRNGSRSRKM